MNVADQRIFNQAVSLAQAGNKASAYITLTHLHQRYPENTAVLLWLSWTTEDLAEARYALQSVERLEPANLSLAEARHWLIQRERLANPAPSPHTSQTEKQHQTENFQNAVQLALAGELEAAYNILVILYQSYPNQVNLLLWLAYTTPNLTEANEALELAGSIEPANPALAKAWERLAAQSKAGTATTSSIKPEQIAVNSIKDKTAPDDQSTFTSKSQPTTTDRPKQQEVELDYEARLKAEQEVSKLRLQLEQLTQDKIELLAKLESNQETTKEALSRQEEGLRAEYQAQVRAVWLMRDQFEFETGEKERELTQLKAENKEVKSSYEAQLQAEQQVLQEAEQQLVQHATQLKILATHNEELLIASKKLESEYQTALKALKVKKGEKKLFNTLQAEKVKLENQVHLLQNELRAAEKAQKKTERQLNEVQNSYDLLVKENKRTQTELAKRKLELEKLKVTLQQSELKLSQISPIKEGQPVNISPIAQPDQKQAGQPSRTQEREIAPSVKAGLMPDVAALSEEAADQGQRLFQELVLAFEAKPTIVAVPPSNQADPVKNHEDNSRRSQYVDQIEVFDFGLSKADEWSKRLWLDSIKADYRCETCAGFGYIRLDNSNKMRKCRSCNGFGYYEP